VEAPLKACVGTDGKCQCLTPQVAAGGRGVIEGAAQRATVAPLGLDACTQQESKGGVGKKLRRSRQGPRGQAQAMEHHGGHGFAWRHHCLLIWHETGIEHGNQPSVFDQRRNHASVIETFDAHLCHGTPLP
jgi:hypothetical protein